LNEVSDEDVDKRENREPNIDPIRNARRSNGVKILNKFENQIFKCSKRDLTGHLTGAGGSCSPNFVGILTYFRAKIKKKGKNAEHF
jgi:hypothetical protein